MDKPRRTENNVDALRDPKVLYAILDMLPGYVYFVSPEHQILYANRLFRKQFGETDGRACYEVLRGRTSPCDDCKPLKALREKKTQRAILTHANGRTYAVHSYAMADKTGNPFVIKLGIDCTEQMEIQLELQRSEQRYRSLFQRNLAGFYQSTLDGTLLNCNQAFANILGYADVKQMKAFQTQDLYFYPAERDAYFTELKQQQHLNGYELRLRKSDGNPVWCLLNVSLVNDEQYNGPIVEGTLIDITPRKLAEQQLKNSHEQLRHLYENLQSVREKEQERIAIEFHDRIGQTFTGLKIDLTWLQRHLPEDQPQILQKTNEMLEQLNDTMNSVREIAAEIKPPILNDFGISATIVWLSKEFQRKTGIDCAVNCSPAEFSLDDSELSTAIFRVFQEILTNVVRHAQASHVYVNFMKESNEITLSVQDDGVGFIPEKIKNPETLGILGMKSRLHHWGGVIDIVSEPGHGTIVSVKVPLRKKIRVLIADDHDIVRRGMRQILSESPDIQISAEAKDGFETIQKVWEKEIDVLILDLSMPGKSGFEVLDQLKHYRPNLPVLVLSVHADQEYAIRALRAGCAGYLTKDTVNEELISAIRQIAAGKTFITAALAEQVAIKMTTENGAQLHHKLSNREFQVMCMLASGMTVKHIAKELSLSVSTVSTTRSRMLKKMGMDSNAAITYYAIKNGLVK